MFQVIVDGDTTRSSSDKRVRKSVDVTVKFAGICADLKEKSDIGNICFFFKNRKFFIFSFFFSHQRAMKHIQIV
jgi:hypothetical protein